MKKSLIAAAGASLAVAAMPVVGVFAADTATVVDTVKVTISDSCTIVNNSDSAAPSEGGAGSSSSESGGVQHITNTYVVTMSLGQLKQGIGGPGADGGAGQTSGGGASTTGGSVSVVCNGDNIQPAIDGSATGTGSWKLTALASNSGNMVGTNASNTIATNTNTSGATSGWAFKIEGTSGETAYSGTYSTYGAIPTSSTEIIRGKGAFTFKPRYQVYIGTTQAADTYTGIVTYTLTAPAA